MCAGAPLAVPAGPGRAFRCSVLRGAVLAAGKRGCVGLFPPSRWLSTEPAGGLWPELQAQSWGARGGGSPTVRAGGQGRVAGRASRSPHRPAWPWSHRQGSRRTRCCWPGLRTVPGWPRGPRRLEEIGKVKPFPCRERGKAVLVSSKAAPDSQKPRGAGGGWKPRVKSNHTSRMGQCHRPQQARAHHRGLCPCRV